MIPIPWAIIVKFLIKSAPYIIGVAVVGWLLWSVYSWDQSRLDSKYEEGYAAREAIAVEAERNLLLEKNRTMAKRVREEKQRKELDKQHLIEVLDAERERNENLQRDIVDLSNKRMFVNVKKPTSCDRERMPGGGDTSIDAGETERAELSASTQRDIRSFGIDTQQLVNRYLTLVDFIEKNQGECLKIIGDNHAENAHENS